MAPSKASLNPVSRENQVRKASLFPVPVEATAKDCSRQSEHRLPLEEIAEPYPARGAARGVSLGSKPASKLAGDACCWQACCLAYQQDIRPPS